MERGHWTEQLPIAGGLLGAFVGGNVDFQRIPLSTPDFYAYDRNKLEDEKNVQKSVVDRFSLLNQPSHINLMEPSKPLFSEHIKESLGGFQYLYDIMLLYGNRHTILDAKIRNMNFTAPFLGMKTPAIFQTMLRENKETHSLYNFSAGSNTLHLRSGMIDAYHLRATSSFTENRYERWFPDDDHDVLHGSISCIQISKKGMSRNCVDVMMALFRQQNEDQYFHSSKVKFEKIEEHGIIRGAVLGSKYRDAWIFETQLHSTPSRIVPNVAVCGVVLCQDGVMEIKIVEGDDDVLVCKGASRIEILLSTAKHETLGEDPLTYGRLETDRVLSNTCLENVKAIIVKVASSSLEKTEAMSAEKLRKQMNRLRLKLGDGRGASSFLSSSMAKYALLQNVMIERQFNFGRYLLLKSGSKAVANLQGLWADGPSASWNGDYHLNINMQMLYWSQFAGRMEEVYEGYLGFVTKLQQKGKTISKIMCFMLLC